METSEVQKLLQEGIEAAKAAHRPQSPSISPLTQKKYQERARQLLFQVTILDETNVLAWLWLSSVMDSPADKIACLENVLALDPNHQTARAGLERLQPQKTTSFIKKIPRSSSEKTESAPEQSSFSNNSQSFNHNAPPAPSQGVHLSASVELLETADVPDPTKPAATPCPFCQKPIVNSDITCPHCALPLIMECPACATSMDVEWDTCKECGQPMGDYRLGSVYFTLLAMAYQQHNRLHKALEALLVARRMNPKQPDLHRYLGELQAELGNIGEAIVTLQQAIKQEPDQAGPSLALGRVLQKEGRWEEAEKVYRAAMSAIPQSSEPVFALGDLMMQRGHLSKARHYFKKAIRLDPNHGLAWAQLGELSERTHNHSAAVRAYQRAIKMIDPNLPVWQQIQDRLDFLASESESNSGGFLGLLRKIVGD